MAAITHFAASTCVSIKTEIAHNSEATTYEIKLALMYLHRVYLGLYINAHSRTYFCKEALEELSVLEWRVDKGMLVGGKGRRGLQMN